MTARTKPFWRSSTVWINFLGAVAVILGFVVQSNLIPDADAVAIIVAALNIINRFRAPRIITPIALR